MSQSVTSNGSSASRSSSLLSSSSTPSYSARSSSSSSSSQPPAKKLKMSISNSAFLTTLKVIVGPERTEFIIQRDLICSESPFFLSACPANLEPNHTPTIILAEDCPKVFSIFLTWLLTKSLSAAGDLIKMPITTPDADEDTINARKILIQDRYDQLIDCYVFGTVIQSHKFQNIIMDAIIIHCKKVHNDYSVLEGTSDDQITRVFEATSEDSSLRRFVLDFILACVDVDGYIEGFDGLKVLHNPQLGFCEAILKLSMKTAKDQTARSELTQPWRYPACRRYHQHPDQPAGYSCSKS